MNHDTDNAMDTNAISRVFGMLGRCGGQQPVLPPTELYNEGWMLRLVLDWFDKHREADHPLALLPDATWYSEALLPSRFLPERRGDPLAESFTHADGVIGHIKIDSGVRGDASLLPRLSQFVVTEAKLGSSLSAGTKNAPSYDQAARNVACMAYMLGVAGIDPSKVERLGFYVIAPKAQIESGVFGELVTDASIKGKVAGRVADYGEKHRDWFDTIFLPTLSRIDLGLLAWEDILTFIDSQSGDPGLDEFYGKCLEHNPLRNGRTPTSDL
jgi:hypothetical protein